MLRSKKKVEEGKMVRLKKCCVVLCGEQCIDEYCCERCSYLLDFYLISSINFNKVHFIT